MRHLELENDKDKLHDLFYESTLIPFESKFIEIHYSGYTNQPNGLVEVQYFHTETKETWTEMYFRTILDGDGSVFKVEMKREVIKK